MRNEESFALFARFERVDHPPRGRHEGLDGAPGVVRLKSGKTLKSKGFQVIPAGDRLLLDFPGGGGLDNPAERDPLEVEADLANGLVSPAAARTVYKVAVRDDLTVDRVETARLRRAGPSPV